jgi:hypothetical protein
MFYRKVSLYRLLITPLHPRQNNHQLSCEHFSRTSRQIFQRNILKDRALIAEQNELFKLLHLVYLVGLHRLI